MADQRVVVCLEGPGRGEQGGELGMGVSEACATDITDPRYEAGYELLQTLGKGAKPAPHPGAAHRARRRRPGAQPARSCGPDRAADGPRRRHPGPDPGRPKPSRPTLPAWALAEVTAGQSANSTGTFERPDARQAEVTLSCLWAV